MVVIKWIHEVTGKLCVGIGHKNINFSQLQLDKQHEILVSVCCGTHRHSSPWFCCIT